MLDIRKTKAQLIEELTALRTRVQHLEAAGSRPTEDALSSSQEQASLFADLLERLSQPFAVRFPDGRLALCNSAFLQLTGYSREECASADWIHDLTPPEWREVERERLEELHRTGQPVRYEKECIRKDGSRVPIELLVHLVRDESGQPDHYYSFLTDISERKRAENALRTSESFLRSMVEQNPCPVWISDDKGTLLKLNQALRDLLQVSDEEIVGKYNIFQDNIVEEAGLMPQVRRVFEEGRVARFELEYDSSRLKGLSLERNASATLDVTVFPIRNAAGKITNAVIQHVDITDRKRAEEALRVAKGRLEMAQRAAGAGIWDWDIESGKIEWSPQMFALFGLGQQAATASFAAWGSVVHPDDRGPARARIERALAERTDLNSEYRVVGPDGQVSWISALGRASYDQGGRAVRMAGICIDITERRRAEEALRESEERFREVVENISEVLWLTDWVNRDLLYVSPSYETVFGRSRESLYKNRRSWIDAIHPEDRARIDRTFAEKGERGEYTEEEYRIICPDGATRWIRDRSFPVYDAKGGVSRWVGVAEDVTERKLAVDALCQERDFAEGLIETAQAIILVLDPQGRIVHFNPYMERVAGRRLEEVQGADWFDTFLPEQGRAGSRELFLKAIGDIQTRGNVDALLTKDGRQLWVEWYDKTLKDRDGRVVGLLAIGQDVTERRRAEEALQRAHDELEQRVRERTSELTAANERLKGEAKHRESTEAALRDSRDLLRAVMDGITDVIFTKNLDGRYCLANAAITAWTGKTPREVIGRDSTDIFPPEEARRRREEDRTVMQTKTPIHCELTVSIQGQPRSFLLSKMPHLDSRGEVVGIIGIARDITEFKQTQELLRRAERLASVGTLAAGIAHEINNPVGAIYLATQNALSCLEENGDRQEVTKCLHDVLEDAARCGKIVSNLLRFAKEEPLEKEPVDLVVVLEKAVEILRPLAEERGVALDVALSPAPPHVLANRTALLQAMENVIRNGIQASDTGHPVNIGLECVGREVRVAVTDLGAGLTTEQQEHMFDPFYTSRRTEGGTGLGLSIVHGVIADHAGTIHVESTRGQGTKVTLVLPTYP